MPAAVYLSHPSSLLHDTGGHPERAQRILAIERELDARGWLGLERLASPAAGREPLEAVHAPDHVAAIERLCAAGGGPIDLDTVASSGSWEAALHAAGGAVALVDLLQSGAAPAGFSVHRPPGHHADATRSMGFCLFNNVAVAAQHALDAHGLTRLMVLDFDVHHGNGTNDIFHATDAVLYVSIHESPLYPGTGPPVDVGSGAGEGYTVNLPVGPGADDALYASLVEHVVADLARAYEPQLVLVSAGFDAHVEDPLADCRVTEAGYAAMTGSLRRLCAELEVPLGAVLEGGYALGALARSMATMLELLNAPAPPPAPELALHPVAAEARTRLARQLTPG